MSRNSNQGIRPMNLIQRFKHSKTYFKLICAFSNKPLINEINRLNNISAILERKLVEQMNNVTSLHMNISYKINMIRDLKEEINTLKQELEATKILLNRPSNSPVKNSILELGE